MTSRGQIEVAMGSDPVLVGGLVAIIAVQQIAVAVLVVLVLRSVANTREAISLLRANRGGRDE